ncbi:hypothetical protein FRB97_000326 [Tulasnella sp. 331]|nr:hypothetical protein FRB97_000326 [Tulasnella sp. 331]
MSFSVYYKFKSQRQESRVTFDGTGISVFDLKKEIILQNNLKASDIDLLLFDNAEQEYKDDHFMIPRSTSVIAKRMPAARPGRGRAQIYVANVGGPSGNNVEATANNSRNGPAGHSGGPGGGAGQFGSGRFQGIMSKRFDGRDLKQMSNVPSASSTPPIQSSQNAPESHTAPPGAGDDEAAQIAAMFAATSEQWEETQEKMAQSVVLYRGPYIITIPEEAVEAAPAVAAVTQTTLGLPINQTPDRFRRVIYVTAATRRDCPTNDDREFDNRPRVKRTTGIPRSFLKAVDISAEGTPAKGVMVTPEGGFVVAEPDSAAWERQRAKPKGLTEAEVKDRPPREPALACSICSKVLKDAVKTPCCQTSYCEECIHTHLLDGTFECPGCKARIPSLDKLKIDSEMRARVREYIRDTVEESRKEVEEVVVESGQHTQTKTTPDLKDAEEFSETQPGNDDSNTNIDGQLQGQQQQQPFMDPRALVTQLQAQLAQLMIMQSNPTLPPQQRMSIGGQIQQLTFQLQQAEHFRDMMNMNMNGGMGMLNNRQPGMNGGGMGMGVGIGGGGGMGLMGMGRGMPMGQMQPGMGMGMMNGGGGYGGPQQQQPGMNQQQQYGMQQQQPGGSAYDRLPINNRRVKRDRPEDFTDVSGPNSKRQYWE